MSTSESEAAAAEFKHAMNMSPRTLEAWLKTAVSKSNESGPPILVNLA